MKKARHYRRRAKCVRMEKNAVQTAATPDPGTPLMRLHHSRYRSWIRKGRCRYV